MKARLVNDLQIQFDGWVIDEVAIRARYEPVKSLLDERACRLLAGTEALAIGRGGVSAAARATGLARSTVQRGVADVRGGEAVTAGRVRREGAGRPPIEERDPTLRHDLEALIEPTSRGDPESPLRWTTKSVRKLAAELRREGHAVSHQTISGLLHGLGYSLQANRKTLEGTSHPDRDAQFTHLDEAVQLQLALGEPVISVDTKKKKLVGPFLNGGRELHPKGGPEPVRMHDFVIPELGRASPYGVYDITQNEAWVSVGTDHDTAAFAVESIRRWWHGMGAALHPDATRILITADAGGSNGYPESRSRQPIDEYAATNTKLARRMSLSLSDDDIGHVPKVGVTSGVAENGSGHRVILTSLELETHDEGEPRWPMTGWPCSRRCARRSPMATPTSCARA